jgi:predicted  nucleic acid-binding Zn-ribbon protein
MNRDARGRRVKFSKPTGADWPELATALDRIKRLEEAERAEGARLEQLARARAVAVDRDREALAEALAAGKPEPREKDVAKIDLETAAAKRRLEGYSVALDGLDAELAETIELHRPGWLDDCLDRVADAAARFSATVEELDAARVALAEAHALARWLEGWPDKLPKVTPAVPTGRVPGLPEPNGEGHLWATVVAALRELPDPPSGGDLARIMRPLRPVSVSRLPVPERAAG